MKKILAILLALTLVFSMAGMTAFAAYAGTDEAIAAEAQAAVDFRASVADTGIAAITLTEDIVLNAPVFISRNLTINLNGHSISADPEFYRGGGSYALIINEGAVAISGPGSVESAVYSPVKLAAAAGKTASLTVDGADIVGLYYGVVVFGNATADSAVFTLTSGSISCIDPEGIAISGNGNMGLNDGTVININGGTVTGGTDNGSCGIYHPQDGVINITGGTITGYNGIMIKCGDVNMSGGTVIGTGAAQSPVPYDNGAETSGAGIGATSNDAYAGGITINVTGGVVKSEQGYAIDHYSTDVLEGESDYVEVVEVSGDTTLVAAEPEAVNIMTKDIEAGTDVDIAEVKPEAVIVDEAVVQAVFATGDTTDETIVIANSTPSYIIVIPETVDFGTISRAMGLQTKPFSVAIEDALLDFSAKVTVNVQSDFTMKNAADAAKTLPYLLYNVATEGTELANDALYCEFGCELDAGAPGLIDPDSYGATVPGRVTTSPTLLTRAGAYSDTMVFVCEYVA